MNKLKLATLALLCAAFSAPRAAQAQQWTRQSFLLPKGDFELTGSPARPDLVRMNMSKNSAFEPVEFPVNFFWGVTNHVMIGITHERGLTTEQRRSRSEVQRHLQRRRLRRR